MGFAIEKNAGILGNPGESSVDKHTEAVRVPFGTCGAAGPTVGKLQRQFPMAPTAPTASPRPGKHTWNYATVHQLLGNRDLP